MNVARHRYTARALYGVRIRFDVLFGFLEACLRLLRSAVSVLRDQALLR
jgi:hypothetical protein